MARYVSFFVICFVIALLVTLVPCEAEKKTGKKNKRNKKENVAIKEEGMAKKEEKANKEEMKDDVTVTKCEGKKWLHTP